MPGPVLTLPGVSKSIVRPPHLQGYLCSYISYFPGGGGKSTTYKRSALQFNVQVCAHMTIIFASFKPVVCLFQEYQTDGKDHTDNCSLLISPNLLFSQGLIFILSIYTVSQGFKK